MVSERAKLIAEIAARLVAADMSVGSAVNIARQIVEAAENV